MEHLGSSPVTNSGGPDADGRECEKTAGIQRVLAILNTPVSARPRPEPRNLVTPLRVAAINLQDAGKNAANGSSAVAGRKSRIPERARHVAPDF